MGPTEVQQPLGAETLREIERSLSGKLRAHRLSASFIERNSEDAVQRGWLDYLRAVSGGQQIASPAAYIVQAAFCRAIDELRAEARRADGATVDALLNTRHYAESPAEDFAVEHLAAEELRGALELLPAEERQVLSLHYFEQRSYLESATILFLSERSYRRRLAKATRHLGRLLGAPVPEPGSHLGIEVGVVTWVGLRGARVPLSRGPLEQVIGVFDRLRNGVGSLLHSRPRELATTLTANGTSERIGAIAGGPAGKVVGGCAAAALVCALGVFVVVPDHRHAAAPPHQQAGLGRARALKTPTKPSPVRVRRSPRPSPRPLPPQTPETKTPVSEGPASTARHKTHTTHVASKSHRSHRQLRARKESEEEVQVEQEFSGIAKAGAEASEEAAPNTEAAVAPARESPAVAPTEKSTEASAPATSEGSTSSNQASAEAQAEKQFGAFK